MTEIISARLFADVDAFVISPVNEALNLNFTSMSLTVISQANLDEFVIR